MQNNTSFWSAVARCLSMVVCALLVACGGGQACVEAPVQVLNAQQVAALTPQQTRTLRDVEIQAMGVHLQAMSMSNLAELTDTVRNPNLLCAPHISPLAAISPEQVRLLSTQQVRALGAGVRGIARLRGLHLDTFDALVADASQVAALTPAEYADLPSSYFSRIGDHFAYLSDAVLMSLRETYVATPVNTQSPLAAVTPRQVALLTPRQLALVGTADGAPPRYRFFSRDTFVRAMQNTAFVGRMPPAELVLLNSAQIADLGVQLAHLPDATLQSLRLVFNASPENPHSQVGSITAQQVQALSAAQLVLVADIGQQAGLAALSDAAFAALQAHHAALLQPAHLEAVTAQQLAGLDAAVLAALPVATRLSLSAAQKRLLTPQQLASLATS